MPVHKSEHLSESLVKVIVRHMHVSKIWESCTEDDIYEAADSIGQIVTWSFDAQAYLKEGNFVDSLDDILNPTIGQRAYIREIDGVLRYEWRNGQWWDIGDLPDKTFY